MAKKAQRSTDLAEESSDASTAPSSDHASSPQLSTFRSQLSPSNAQRAFEAAVVDFFVSAAEPLGIPHSVASIYGVIYASPVPLSFSDIAERLDLSKGSISQGLRALRDVGAIRAHGAGKREEERGKGAEGGLPEVSTSPLPLSPHPSRHTAWEPDTEMRRLIERFLESRVQPQLSSGQDRLARLKQLSASFPASDQAILRQRVEKLEAWHSRTRGLLPLIRTFLKLGG